MEGMNWRWSSYSGNSNSGGNCTEVSTVSGTVLVHNSKDPRGPCSPSGMRSGTRSRQQ